jgi:hypothetical protein
MSTLSRLKAVIAVLCIVTAFAAVVLVVAAQRGIWRSPGGGCMVLSGLAGGVLSGVAASRAFQVGQLVTGLWTGLAGSALVVFCGTSLAYATWAAYVDGQPGLEFSLAAWLATMMFFKALDWVFEEPSDGTTFLRD